MNIVSSWDDGAYLDLRLSGMLQEYKIPAVFYFPAYWREYCKSKGIRPLDLDEAKIIARNHEIGSHGLTHALLTRIPLAEAAKEIQQSKVLLEETFKRKITKFCYPRGYANPEIMKLVKLAGYKEARSTLVGYLHESENPFFIQTTVHVGCDRKEYGGLDWFAYALNMLEEAKKTPRSIYHLWGHSHEIARNGDWGKVKQLFKILHEDISS